MICSDTEHARANAMQGWQVKKIEKCRSRSALPYLYLGHLPRGFRTSVPGSGTANSTVVLARLHRS